MKLLKQLNKCSIPTVKLSYYNTQQEKVVVKDSKQTYDLIMGYWDKNELEHHESFKIILLNPNLEMLGIYTVAEGGTCSVAVDSKLILQAAVLANAHGVILIHNHPSGNLNPSSEDIGLTRDTVYALDMVGVKLRDHLIITKEGYFSFSDNRSFDLETHYLAS